MSDKSYVPASGKTYFVKHSPQGKLLVQEGSGAPTEIQLEASGERIDHQTQRLVLSRGGKARQLFWVYSVRNKRVLAWPGGSIELDALDLTEGAGGGGGKLKPLKLTMPGKVLNVKVSEGDIVEAGQGLVIVEAMKMENLLLAPARAKVLKVHIKTGDRLESGAILITFGNAE
jgi:acetyl/propionyl-CoA carboxylase alpha subunit